MDQGTTNVSHGCVNLPPEDAVIYYNMSIPGDPITILNSTAAGKWDDGWTPWFFTWSQYLKGSALGKAVRPARQHVRGPVDAARVHRDRSARHVGGRQLPRRRDALAGYGTGCHHGVPDPGVGHGDCDIPPPAGWPTGDVATGTGVPVVVGDVVITELPDSASTIPRASPSAIGTASGMITRAVIRRPRRRRCPPRPSYPPYPLPEIKRTPPSCLHNDRES